MAALRAVTVLLVAVAIVASPAAAGGCGQLMTQRQDPLEKCVACLGATVKPTFGSEHGCVLVVSKRSYGNIIEGCTHSKNARSHESLGLEGSLSKEAVHQKCEDFLYNIWRMREFVMKSGVESTARPWLGMNAKQRTKFDYQFLSDNRRFGARVDVNALLKSAWGTFVDPVKDYWNVNHCVVRDGIGANVPLEERCSLCVQDKTCELVRLKGDLGKMKYFCAPAQFHAGSPVIQGYLTGTDIASCGSMTVADEVVNRGAAVDWDLRKFSAGVDLSYLLSALKESEKISRLGSDGNLERISGDQPSTSLLGLAASYVRTARHYWYSYGKILASPIERCAAEDRVLRDRWSELKKQFPLEAHTIDRTQWYYCDNAIMKQNDYIDCKIKAYTTLIKSVFKSISNIKSFSQRTEEAYNRWQQACRGVDFTLADRAWQRVSLREWVERYTEGNRQFDEDFVPSERIKSLKRRVEDSLSEARMNANPQRAWSRAGFPRDEYRKLCDYFCSKSMHQTLRQSLAGFFNDVAANEEQLFEVINADSGGCITRCVTGPDEEQARREKQNKEESDGKRREKDYDQEKEYGQKEGVPPMPKKKEPEQWDAYYTLKVLSSPSLKTAYDCSETGVDSAVESAQSDAEQWITSLGTPPDLSGVKRMYRQAVITWHPDHNRASGFSDETFKALTAANDLVKDEDVKRQYDRAVWRHKKANERLSQADVAAGLKQAKTRADPAVIAGNMLAKCTAGK